MESLANYGSDDEVDSGAISNVNGVQNTVTSGIEGDNYDDVQMDMSENPLNGSKAPSVQAFPQGLAGGALTIESDSNCGDFVKDESPSEPHEAERCSSSSPASAASSGSGSSKSDVPTSKSEPVSEEKDSEPESRTSRRNQDRRDKESRSDRQRGRDTEDKERPRERDRHRDREVRDRDRDRRSDRGRSDRDRHRSRSRSRSRSRDRKERRRSPERRRSREKPSPIRDHKRSESDRRYSESRGRDYDRKKHRSRSRSSDRHHASRDSRRSSSSSRSCKSDARSRESKAQTASSKRSSRSRSRSLEKERERPRPGDSRKFFLEKKIDRKMNVLERMGIELKPETKLGATGLVTPQMLVQRTMELQAAQVKEATGVELPSYYNAAAVNAHRLVDQIQKRKLLWGSKKEEQADPACSQPSAANKWQGATFAQDQDGKLTAKFNRLMGIKQPAAVAAEQSSAATGEIKGSEIIKKQEEMFHNMESQYEVARLATHTHRGLGLGFGTFQPR